MNCCDRRGALLLLQPSGELRRTTATHARPSFDKLRTRPECAVSLSTRLSQPVPMLRHALALGGIGQAAEPAATLSRMCSGLAVPGITQVTAGWPRMYLRKNWLQLAQSSSEAHSGRALPRTWPNREPLSNGRLTIDGHAALRAQRQQARFGSARVDRVGELHEVDALGADDGRQLVERGVGVVRDADVAELLLLLPGAQGAQMRAPVDAGCGSASGRSRAPAAWRRRPSSARCRPPRRRSTPWWRGTLRSRAFISASRVPTTASARPYMGEESITLPPASSRMRSTSLRWSSAARSAPTSKACQVPSPTTGSGSLVEGIGRVSMVGLGWALSGREGEQRRACGRREDMRDGLPWGQPPVGVEHSDDANASAASTSTGCASLDPTRSRSSATGSAACCGTGRWAWSSPRASRWRPRPAWCGPDAGGARRIRRRPRARCRRSCS